MNRFLLVMLSLNLCMFCVYENAHAYVVCVQDCGLDALDSFSATTNKSNGFTIYKAVLRIFDAEHIADSCAACAAGDVRTGGTGQPGNMQTSNVYVCSGRGAYISNADGYSFAGGNIGTGTEEVGIGYRYSLPTCLPCPASTYANSGYASSTIASCASCLPGVTSESGSTSCSIKCDGYEYTSSWGGAHGAAPACSWPNCSAGAYLKSNVCTLCPTGFYTSDNDNRSGSCTACPSVTDFENATTGAPPVPTTSGTGATANTYCYVNAGSYKDSIGTFSYASTCTYDGVLGAPDIPPPPGDDPLPPPPSPPEE